MSEQIIKLSNNAAERIKQIMSKAENSAIGVRVGVKSGGCAGMSYVMEYAKEIKPNDGVPTLKKRSYLVFIDPKAIIYLLGQKWIILTTIIHFKFYWMRCVLKIIDFLKFKLDVRIYLIISKNSTLS